MSDDDVDVPVEVPVKDDVPVVPTDLVAQATAAAERLEKANAELDALIKRQEAANVERTLSGSAVAGVPPKVLSKDEREKADAKAFLAGTGFEDIIE